MKRILQLLIVISMMVISSFSIFAQPIPEDSMFLGQQPPGNTPKMFNLPVNTGSFAAERIAFSNDGSEIYYSEVQSYYPAAGDTIKYYRYSEENWKGPFVLFGGYIAPALSVNNDTMYFQNANIVNSNSVYETFISVKNGLSWSSPQKILSDLNSAHYLQATNNGHYYISSISNPSIGAADWCNLFLSGTDTTAISLGLPLNSGGDNLDFYIARDESFIIIAKGGLQISFPKADGSWTNPKNLGKLINFGLNEWGPFVTNDNKYLFYTTGTKQDYSDTYVYWVRIDDLIDSLKQTNFLPYLNYKIPNQTDSVGYNYNYTFPETTFIDDDGNNTLTYTATLYNGNPLPAWLNFDPATRTLYGTPTSTGTLFLKFTATDTANAKASCTFTLKIENPISSVDDDEQCLNDYKLFQNYPNPFNPTTKINWQASVSGWQTLIVYDVLGKIVATLIDEFKSAGSYEVEFNATNISSGIYFYVLKTARFYKQMKMIVLK